MKQSVVILISAVLFIVFQLASANKNWILNSAAARGMTPVVKITLKLGADVNAPDKRGYTPLMNAAANGHMKTVQILITRGADIHASGADGATARGLAFKNKHVLIEDLLLERGAL